jgi:hypothetical protein
MSGQRRDEVAVLKIYDSAEGVDAKCKFGNFFGESWKGNANVYG